MLRGEYDILKGSGFLAQLLKEGENGDCQVIVGVHKEYETFTWCCCNSTVREAG